MVLAWMIIACMQVAIKKMKRKFYSWEECLDLREVKVRQLGCTDDHGLFGGRNVLCSVLEFGALLFNAPRP